jgi:hemerythrin
MSVIEWREEFSVGLPEVDHEHQELIAAINRLHGEIGSGASPEEVTDRLGEIESAISAHFALEEKSMAALRYDDYAAHKNDHEQLLDEILDIRDGVLESGQYEADALRQSLTNWFREHFRTHDMRLHHWLAKRH